MSEETLGVQYDFDKLRAANRDSDGSVISGPTEYFLAVSSALLQRIPSNWEAHFNQSQGDLRSWINTIQQELNFLITLIEKPVGERAARIAERATQLHTLTSQSLNPLSLEQLVAIIAVGEAQGGQIQAQAQKIAELREEAQVQLAIASTAASQAQELLRSTQEAAAAATASGRARIFANEAQLQDRLAAGWLIFSAAVLAALIGLAAAFAGGRLIPRPASTDTFALANYVLAKVLILAATAFALTFGTKQYATHRHNATMNRHRSHALRTYRALVQASRGEDVHDIILKEAADAIFAPQDSGYLKGSSDGSGGVVQVIQGLLRSPTLPHSSP